MTNQVMAWPFWLRVTFLPCLLATASGVFCLGLPQVYIDALYQPLTLLSFDVLLLKTQHLSFVHEYLVQHQDEARWHRIVLHYAIGLPIFFYLWFLLITIIKECYTTCDPGKLPIASSGLPPQTPRHSKVWHAMILIFFPLLLFTLLKILTDIFLDMFFINPETMAGTPVVHTGRLSWVTNTLFQNEIHNSDTGFFHMAFSFFLQGVMYIVPAFLVGTCAKALVVFGPAEFIKLLWARLHQRYKNYVFLYFPVLAMIALKYASISEDCLRGGVSVLHYSLIWAGGLCFIWLLIEAFRKQADDHSLLRHSLFCTLLFALACLNSILAAQMGLVCVP